MGTRSKASKADPSKKPSALDVREEGISDDLKGRPHWVVWRWEWRTDEKGEGTWTKPPFTIDGRSASSTDPSTWNTFEAVLAAYRTGEWDGIGLIHLPEDDLTGCDMDDCRNPDTEANAIDGWALRIVLELHSYTEVSPSGTGLRTYVGGRKPNNERCLRKRLGGGAVEMYDGETKAGKPGGRFLTVTGHRLTYCPATIEHRQEEIAAVYRRELLGQSEEQPDEPAPPPHTTNGEAPAKRTSLSKVWTAKDNPCNLDDDHLVKRMCEDDALAKSLFEGSTAGHKSNSEAVLALCNKLRFWGGRDRHKIRRLFRMSKLWSDKWDRASAIDPTLDLAMDGEVHWSYTNGDGNAGSNGKADAPNGTGAAHTWTFHPLAGEVGDEEEPELIAGLFYRDMRHVVYGPTGCQKTWLAAVAAAEIIRLEQNVLWLDFEMGEREVKKRLAALGLSAAERARLHYGSPAEALAGATVGELRSFIETIDPRLVVVDAFSGALGVQQLDEDKNPQVEQWWQTVGRALAGDHARCLIVLDNVKKGEEASFAIGAQRKVSGADVGFKVKAVRHLNRSPRTDGLVQVHVDRDRHGWIGQGTTREFELRHQGDAIAYSLRPAQEGGEGKVHRPTNLMENASRIIEDAGAGVLSKNQVEQKMKGIKTEAKRRAIALLVEEQYVATERRGTADRLTSLKPFRDGPQVAVGGNPFTTSPHLAPSRPDLAPDEVCPISPHLAPSSLRGEVAGRDGDDAGATSTSPQSEDDIFGAEIEEGDA